ncbi:MAG: SMI1/KNR4 family protein [bacterium]|nr:SMI1/KNR4 family protein [bacterium]
MDQIESVLGVKFPKKFREIHSKGVMEWMEQNVQKFRENREKYINDPSSFLMLECDCEPLFFEDIPKRIEELKEWISWREEDEGAVFNEKMRLIPFAQNGAGDLFCFLYEEDMEEPRIVLYYHDDYSGPVLEADSFDEFLYVILLQSASWSKDINNDYWKSHYQLLSDKYKGKIAGKTAEELAEEYEDGAVECVDIWRRDNSTEVNA